MKKRQKITEMIITQSAEIASVFPQDNGTLLIVDIHGNPVEHIQHEAVAYLRDSGKPKILRSIPRTTVDRVGDNPWKKYDKIGFIDTNSVLLHDERLFVCSASVRLWADESRRFANLHSVDLFVGYCSIDVNPERLGWRDFINRVESSYVLKRTERMLLVVDSEAGLLPSINDRTEPVFSDYSLPSRFTLARATSDSGAESWINKEMRRRDSAARRALTAIQRNQTLLEILRRAEPVYIKDAFESAS